MSGEIDDKAFEEYLKRGSPMSHHYQALHSDELPAAIDRQVLARAEEAIRAPVVSKARVWQRWSVPVALAASTVLAVSIVIESGQDERALTRGPSYAEPARETASASDHAEERKAEEGIAAQAIEPLAAPTAASEEVRSEAAAHERKARALREEARRRSQARSVAAPPSVEALAKRAEPEAERDAVADTRTESASARRAEARNDQAMQPVAPAPAPLTVPAVPREGQRASSAARPTSAESPGFASQEQNAKVRLSDPEEWLREIRELRAAGKTEEADREWKAFRESFPDYAVAEDDPAIGP